MKKYILSILSLLLSCMVFSNCNFIAREYSDRESDKAEAEKVVDELYNYLQKGDFDSASKLFAENANYDHDSLKKERLIRLFVEKEEEYGIIQNRELVRWKTFRKTGRKPFLQYDLVYKVNRASGLTTESVIMTNENNRVVIVIYAVIPNVL